MQRLKRGGGFSHLVMVCLAGLALMVLTGRGGADEPVADRAAPLSVSFSHANGVYDRPISLSLGVAAGDADILFTTDGNMPMPGEAAVYERPLYLAVVPADVVVVRARA